MFKPKSILLYTWHHSWTHWTYSLEKLIQTVLPLHLSLASGSLFTHLSFPEISQSCVLFPVFFCDQKWTVRWRVKYLRGKVGWEKPSLYYYYAIMIMIRILIIIISLLSNLLYHLQPLILTFLEGKINWVLIPLKFIFLMKNWKYFK